MFDWKNEKTARRMRRYLTYLRRGLVLLGFAVIIAALIITPIRIVNAVRESGDKDTWIVSVFGGNRNAKKTNQKNKQTTATTTRPTEPIVEEPELPAAEDLGGKVQSEYAALLDMTEGRVIAAKNGDVAANPASITKIMTLLVAVENIEDLQATYTMSWKIINPPYEAGASTTGLSSGEETTFEALLYGCILPSGADATAALADYVADHEVDYDPADEAVFAEMMNKKAAELGAVNTHFTNSSGLHDANHKTTASDMALIMAAAMKNLVCREVLMAKEYRTPATEQHPDGILLTSTAFRHIGSRDTCITAGKPGSTDQALNTLATYAKIDGHEYVFVSMCVNGSDLALEDAHNVYAAYANWQRQDEKSDSSVG